MLYFYFVCVVHLLKYSKISDCTFLTSVSFKWAPGGCKKRGIQSWFTWEKTNNQTPLKRTFMREQLRGIQQQWTNTQQDGPSGTTYHRNDAPQLLIPAERWRKNKENAQTMEEMLVSNEIQRHKDMMSWRGDGRLLHYRPVPKNVNIMEKLYSIISFKKLIFNKW